MNDTDIENAERIKSAINILEKVLCDAAFDLRAEKIKLDKAYAERVQPTRRKLVELKDELDDLDIAVGKANPLVGKMVTRDTYHRTGYNSGSWVPIYGTVEVRERSTPMPAGISSYTMPKLGELFVRLHKKDGTPGVRIDVNQIDESFTKKERWRPADV